MIDDQNYVAAYMTVKQSGLSDLDQTEYTGKIASTIVDELGRCSRREERERAIYLRSILAWIFRDVPGLSSLYREQIRLVHSRGDFATDMYEGFKTINDVASGRKGFSEGMEDTVDKVRRSIEDAAENFRSGDPSEGVRNFVSAAEHGLRDGLNQMGRFFEGLNQQAAGRREEAPGAHDSHNDDPATDFSDSEFSESFRRHAEDVDFSDDDDEND